MRRREILKAILAAPLAALWPKREAEGFYDDEDYLRRHPVSMGMQGRIVDVTTWEPSRSIEFEDEITSLTVDEAERLLIHMANDSTIELNASPYLTGRDTWCLMNEGRFKIRQPQKWKMIIGRQK